MEFYVSPQGKDENPGTRAQPFATIGRARDEVRRAVAAGLKAPLTVWLRGGRYELREPLVFGPADSGAEQLGITYAAFGQEQPCLSGGRVLRGWQRAKGDLWRLQLDQKKTGAGYFRQLFRDGERLTRSRFPNQGKFLTIKTVAPDVRQIGFQEPLPTTNFAGGDVELVVLHNWAVSRETILYSQADKVVTSAPAGWIGHHDLTACPGKAAFLENAPVFVDQPGEWYLDRAQGELTYLAAPGEDPNQRQFIAPALEQLVRIEGTRSAPVRNLTFRGLSFEHAEFPLPYSGYCEIQAGHYGTRTNRPTLVQPVAIELVYAQQCRFERCRLAHMGASGIGLGPGCRQNQLIGCELTDIGGNGVMVGWRGKGDLAAGATGTLDADWLDPRDAPQGNEVANNLIERCGTISYGCVGVFVAFAPDTRVAHNEVRDLPYTGISVGYRWDTATTSQRGCLVEGNHIHGVMQLLADGGGIYTLGLQPGTVLRSNLIYDVRRSPVAFGGAPNNGIFFDAASKDIRVDGNIIYQTSGEPIRLNLTSKEWFAWGENSFGVQPGEPGFPKPAADRVAAQAGRGAKRDTTTP
jgi:hypothetical protein